MCFLSFFNFKKLKTNMLLCNLQAVKKFFFLAGLIGVFLPTYVIGQPLFCDLTAETAFLINADTGKVLFSKNADAVFYPASTTKTATLLYALHRKKDHLDDLVTVSHNAVACVSIPMRRTSGKHPSYRLEYGGTHMGLKVGEQVDLRTLLYGLMLPSANDGANVIAEMVSGSVPQFITELNQFLLSIGCQNTHFTNPHGLPDPDHKTTARDLARIAQVGMRDPIFREIVSSHKYVKSQTNKQPETVLDQHNALVKPRHKHFYPHATGVKIGYTIQAGHAIVASAQKGDRSLIAVVAHREGAAQRYRSVIQLFEAAFTEPKQTRILLSKVHDVFYQNVEGSKSKLIAMLEEDVTVAFYPSEDKTFHSKLLWNLGALPILAGTKVGEIQIFDEHNVLQKTAVLTASKSVEPTFSYQMGQKMQAGKLWIQKQKIYMAYSMAFILFAIAMLAIMRAKKRVKSSSSSRS